jgi:hypothetical protein
LQNLSGLARLSLLQITTALRASCRRGRVTRTAESAVNVRTGFGCHHRFFVGDDLLIRRALEFHVNWLRRAAILAGFYGTSISAIAIGTHPFEFDKSHALIFLHLYSLILHECKAILQ